MSHCRYLNLLVLVTLAFTTTPQLQLHNGASMPFLGLGTYQVEPGAETYAAVKSALAQGYRMVDTAQMYGNEADVGSAILDSGIAREEIWVQSKLLSKNHGYRNAIDSITATLQQMGLDYLDCFLIHSPYGGKLIETWDALLQLQSEGKIRSVGVSNFGVHHLQALTTHGRPVPVMNQIEMHPLILAERQALVDYCQEQNIVVQAYGSLFYGQTDWLKHPKVESVSKQTGRTPAQVLLRWGFQKGFQLIPRSIKPHRLAENLAIFDFELEPAAVEMLDTLEGSLGMYWNPVEDPDIDLGDVKRFDLKREL